MSSQASLSNLTMAVETSVTYRCRFGGPVLIFMGTVGCTLNLIVFTQKNLRKSSCTIYFIAYNITSFLYIYSALLSLIMSLGYNIDLSIYNLVFCRLYLFTNLLFHGLSQFYLILASIDRMMITSHNALTRQRGTHHVAYVCIGAGTIFWALFHSHALILPTIIQSAPNYCICLLQLGIESTFVDYYTVVKETLVLSLMVLSALWSVTSIRGVRRVRAAPIKSTRGAPKANRSHSTSAKGRQLVVLLIVDIAVYALFNSVLGIFFMYRQITQNDYKTPDQIQLENNIRNICLLSITVPCCISCYANLLVSKTFRKGVKKALLWR